MTHRTPNRPPDDDVLAEMADDLGPAVLAEAARRHDLAEHWEWAVGEGRTEGVHTREGRLIWFREGRSHHDSAAAVQTFGDFLRHGQQWGSAAPGPVVSAVHQAIRAIIGAAAAATEG